MSIRFLGNKLRLLLTFLLGLTSGLTLAVLLASKESNLGAYLEPTVPILSAEEAMRFAVDRAGVLEDLLPRESLSKERLEQWKISADYVEDRWRVVLRSRNIIPSYACEISFNQEGLDLNRHRCGWKK
jgi:hypothetical protein